MYQAGILSSTTKYTYNNKNVCTKTEYFDAHGILQWTFEPKFDKNGITIETIRIDADKNLQKVIIERFDSKNNSLGYKVYKNNVLMRLVEYKIEYY